MGFLQSARDGRMKQKEKKRVGKPTLYKKRMIRKNVMLDEDTIKFYTEQGKGNLSEGIRRNWRIPNDKII